MAAFAARQPERSRARTPSRWRRFAVLGGLGVAAAVGACALPVEYSMSLGRGIEITLDVEYWDELEPAAIAHHLHEGGDGGRIEVRISSEERTTVGPDGVAVVEKTMALQLFVFGGELDEDDVWEDLQQEFPALHHAQMQQVPLSGTVHGTLGGKLSHRLLDLQIDRDGVEAAERSILAELAAQGISTDDATVDITHSEDGHGNREIEVRVERHDDGDPPEPAQ